ncbi:unnamed protein product, partial [Rodentolepis nana]|uniref:Exo84_C domain-containing protein n=1 Tax=Rodentolepis nana TaxID=102285 RepID=A0A0R3TTP0_RODNA
RTLNSVIDSKLFVENAESLSVSFHNSEDTEEGLIDDKVDSSSVESEAKVLGLVAKRSYLENCLKSLQSQVEHLNTLKRHMRESAEFSADFERLYTEKKNRLKSLNSYLEGLRKSVTSSKLKTLESYDTALTSSNRLSYLIKDIWSHNDGKAINLASSAVMNISQCLHAPYLSTPIVPPLYQELCMRLNSAPFITPIGRIVDRIQSIVADCRSIDLINEELIRSLTDLKSLRDGLRNSLETLRNGEKEACLAMAGLLKKISINCVKLTDSQKNLSNIWNYWSEFIPQDENRGYSLASFGTLKIFFDDLLNI